MSSWKARTLKDGNYSSYLKRKLASAQLGLFILTHPKEHE